MSVLQLLLLPWVVHSPYFLLVNKQDELGASQGRARHRAHVGADKHQDEQ